MSSLNFMELCRLCLVKERVSIPIFEGEGDVRQILLKIASCLPVKVSRDDKLPKKICDECMYKLDNAYQFWNTTANAEKQLLLWLGDVANEDKKNVPTNTIETEQLVLKEEADEQDIPDVSKNLSRVEAVLDDERGVSDDEDTESDDEGSNSEDTGDDEPPGKEEAESEEEPYDEPLEPTTFVNVTLSGCDEAGPSGIQQPAQTGTTQPAQQLQQQQQLQLQQQQLQAAPSTSSAAAGAVVAATATVPAAAAPPALATAAASTPSGYLLQLYSGDKPQCVLFCCGICGIFFNTQQSLVIHLESHKLPNSNQCGPNNPIAYQYISQTPNNNSQHESPKLPISNLSKPDINTDIPSTYICTVCKKDCKAIHLLRRHMILHELIQCTVCKKTFKCKTYLTKHMVTHRDDRPFPCNDCGRKFKVPFHVAQHKKRVHVGVEKNYQCPICEHKFVDKQQLDVHVRRHSKNYSFHCDVCGKGYYTASDLRRHSNLHDKEKSFQCKLCDHSFLMKDSLNQHYFSAHNKQRKITKLHTCEYCGIKIQRKKDFYRHVRTHTGEKEVHLCDICGKGVSSQDSLLLHKRYHTGEKPYECGHCGKCFSRRQSLKMHVRTHTGERPFSCKECGKSFTQQSTLIVHRRYHTGQRPYKCNVCEKGFVTLTLLKTHQKTACAKN